jgi:hypothetical protein
MSIKTLKQYLHQREKEELIDEIVHLSSKFKIVKDYYQEKTGADGNGKILEKYKSLVTHEFFPTRGHGKARLSIAKKAVADFKKISHSKTELINLMLHYVDMGVRFTNEYGDIDEGFYNSMEGMYDKALKLIIEEKMEQEFQPRCHMIVTNTNGMGWGFHDALAAMFHDAFEQ